MSSRSYHIVTGDDDLPLIVRGEMGGDVEANIGRAVTKRDGEAIVAELNRLGDLALRDRLLAAVSDAIENCF